MDKRKPLRGTATTKTATIAEAPDPSSAQNPNQDMSALVEGILDSGEPGPTASTLAVPQDVAAKQSPGLNKGVQKKPSLAAAMAEQQVAGIYPEENQVRDALNSADPVRTKMKQLGTMSAKDRAAMGAKLGAGIGMTTMGPSGGIIGAAVGAIAGRSGGILQSGEHEDAKRRQRMVQTLNTTGIVDDMGFFKFEDGSVFKVNADPSIKLKNTSSVAGPAYRTQYEIDSSSPFARRATSVARPLAYYMAHGLMKYRDPENPRDQKVLDNTTALLVNAIQSDAKNIQQVYARAKELAAKFGVTKKHMAAFFDQIKSGVPDEDAGSIKQGLDILYTGE